LANQQRALFKRRTQTETQSRRNYFRDYQKLKKMSFSRAKREFFMEKDAKRKSGLPGPQTYDPKTGRNEKGFRYHDLTASTIHEDSRLNCSRDDIDIHRFNTESTPLKRNSLLTSSARGSKNFGMARSNMDKKKAEEEIRRKEAQFQDLSAKYQNLQASHMKIVDLKDELEQIYSKQKEDISHLERKIKDLQSLLDKKNEELKEAEWQIEKLKKEKEELKEAEAKMYQQKIEFEDKNLDAAKRSENDEAKIKELEVSFSRTKAHPPRWCLTTEFRVR